MSLLISKQSSDFIVKPLEHILSFNLFKPTRTNICQIQNYFGPKIALYFLFIQYLVRRLRTIGAFSLLVFILNNTFLAKFKLLEYHFTMLIFSIVVDVWSTSLLENWTRMQTSFEIRFGEVREHSLGSLQKELSQERVRPGFRGVFKKSLWSNKMNTQVFEEKKRLKPIFISILISLAFLAVSVGISLLILYVTEVIWRTSDDMSTTSKVLLTYGGPGLNYILARRLMWIHTRVAIRRTTLENWDTAERFEQSLILKTYFFNFFNLFNSFFIIGLFKPLYSYF